MMGFYSENRIFDISSIVKSKDLRENGEDYWRSMQTLRPFNFSHAIDGFSPISAWCIMATINFYILLMQTSTHFKAFYKHTSLIMHGHFSIMERISFIAANDQILNPSLASLCHPLSTLQLLQSPGHHTDEEALFTHVVTAASSPASHQQKQQLERLSFVWLNRPEALGNRYLSAGSVQL